MPTTANDLRTGARPATLQVELLGPEGTAWTTHPTDVAAALIKIATICRIANGIVAPAEIFVREGQSKPWLEPRLIRVHFGSPVEIIVEMEKQVLGSIAAISVVIYALKRIWQLPVEFRTHAREMQARFEEADARASEAEMRRDEILEEHDEARSESFRSDLEILGRSRGEPRPEDDDLLQALRERSNTREQEDREELALVDEEWNWPRGTTLEIEDMKRSSLHGGSAVWKTED